MQARLIYSATTVITTPHVRILTDPWFTPGWAYDGAWGQYPLIEDPIGMIGAVDLIYVSHIHPDHYDAPFLRAYLDKYPYAKLIIGQGVPYLGRALARDGLSCLEVDAMAWGHTQIHILPNTVGADPIDTALAVYHDDDSVVNLNDNPYDASQMEKLLTIIPNSSRCIGFFPYSGAGPWPQTFRFESAESQWNAMLKKQDDFLKLFEAYRRMLTPRWAVPFAGQYWLIGAQRGLNAFRGVPDPVEGMEYIAKHYWRQAIPAPSSVPVVLDTGGVIDTERGVLGPVRAVPWDPADIEATLDRQATTRPWMGKAPEVQAAAVRALLPAATSRANAAVQVRSGRALVRFVTPAATFAVWPGVPPGSSIVKMDGSPVVPDIEWEITIDLAYLLGLLSGVWQWNNAEVGSQFFSRRTGPFDERVSAWLAHLRA